MGRCEQSHLNMPTVFSKSELRRVTAQLSCDACVALWFLDAHPAKGYCACECHLSPDDLTFIKHRKEA